MKAFITPDAPYRSAARTCRTHNKTFIAAFYPAQREPPRTK